MGQDGPYVIAISPLKRGVTEKPQLYSFLVTSLWPQEGQFQGLRFSEDFVREDSLQEDQLFASSSILRTQESV